MRTLKVKCPTWKHVDAFYKRKLRRDQTLTIRVPFNPEKGSALTVRLQLPDGEDMDVEGEVLSVLPDSSGNGAAIDLRLHGFTAEVQAALETRVQAATQPLAASGPKAPSLAAAKEAEKAARAAGAEVLGSRPEDAPIDELVEAPYEPDLAELSEFEREVFAQLQDELGHLRELAANDVLGISLDAGVEAIRRAYFERTKQFHPDHFARYRSDAVMHMAEEVFIHMNRAYDRMREAAVREGRAVVAGPALLPHEGWLTSLDDISSPSAHEHEAEAHGPQDSVQARAAAFMRDGQLESARSLVATALHGDPRNRSLRALYYVIGGEQALADGDKVLAASQFEAALAHDRECRPARVALDKLRARGEHGGVYPKSLR